MNTTDFLNKYYLYRILAAQYHKWIVKRNPQKEMERVYYKTFNRMPNLQDPRDLIEKIFWLQLNSDTSLWTKCADKYRVREYINEQGMGEYLPKLYGNWDNAQMIDFTQLPQKFILKTNNGCGTCFIVKDKSEVSPRKIINQMNKWLHVPYGWAGAQLHYTKIQPCIIAEELLEDDGNISFSPNSLVDYKIWCFNGKPECCLIVYNRVMDAPLGLALYDLEWNPMPEKMVDSIHYKCNPDIRIPQPLCLSQMTDIASKLSKPFHEVRVDFYVINNKPVIGELTFTTGFGYFTEEYYRYLGDKCEIDLK